MDGRVFGRFDFLPGLRVMCVWEYGVGRYTVPTSKLLVTRLHDAAKLSGRTGYVVVGRKTCRGDVSARADDDGKKRTVNNDG